MLMRIKVFSGIGLQVGCYAFGMVIFKNTAFFQCLSRKENMPAFRENLKRIKPRTFPRYEYRIVKILYAIDNIVSDQIRYFPSE